jgi:hypothetical protein
MTTVSNNTYSQAAKFRSAEFSTQTKANKGALKLDVDKLMGAIMTNYGAARLFVVAPSGERIERTERLLTQLADFVGELSNFLARSDLSDAQRTAFLRRFLGTAIDPDDADGIDHDASGDKLTSALSTLIAAAVSGDIEALNEMLTKGNTIDELDLSAMINNATKDMAEWREKNGVSHTPDTFADDLKKMRGDSDEFFASLANLSPHDKLGQIRARKAAMEAEFGGLS